MKRIYLLIAAIVALVLLIASIRGRNPGVTAEKTVQPSRAQSLNQAPDSAAAQTPADRTKQSNGAKEKLAGLSGPARDTYLRQISTNNPAFQAWGKAKMLDAVNNALAKVQLYGIAAPLNASNTIGTTQLYSGMDSDKWQLWLHTTDGKHRFRYEDGRLYELYAVEGDFLRNDKQPDKTAEWAQIDGKWSDGEARSALVELIKRLDVRLDPDGEGNRVVVEPEEYSFGGKTATPFYTVRLFAQGNIVRAEAHFRSTKNGWQPTLIRFQIRGKTGDDPTAEDLLARFF